MPLEMLAPTPARRALGPREAPGAREVGGNGNEDMSRQSACPVHVEGSGG